MNDYIHTRWAIRNDIPILASIDYTSYCEDQHKTPWLENDFFVRLNDRNCICRIAEIDGIVLGYVLYRIKNKAIDIERLAVCWGCRRRGVGRALLESVKEKLFAHRKKSLTIRVDEENLRAQLWLKACGVKARKVEKGEIFFSHREPKIVLENQV